MENARKIISTYINKGERIALAVSGGKDSMALAHLVLSDRTINREDIAIVHINHKIRADAENDAKLVSKFAKTGGVKLILKEFDVLAISKEQKQSVETAARECRYRFFSELSKDYKYILTAHHLSDDVESVLMHIFRGCGLNGLKGMQVLSGHIFRPLLKTAKEAIEEYVRENNIPFNEDSTNSDPTYSRNFLRNEILPLIRSRWAGVDSSISSLKDEANLISGYLESQMTDVETAKEGVYLTVEMLHSPLSAYYVINALGKIGCVCDYSKEAILNAAKLKNLSSGSKTEILKDVWAVKEYDRVLIHKKIDAPQSLTVPFSIGDISFFNDIVRVKEDSFSNFEKNLKIKSGGDKMSKPLFADLNKIPKTAVLRRRENGDVFCPFKSGSKKLKEYFIDKKIPKRIRDEAILLCDGNEVLAILGVEISDKIKVESDSKIVKIEVIAG